LHYEYIRPSFWTEPDFEEWTPFARTLYLWAATNPYQVAPGITRATPLQIQAMTGMPAVLQADALREIGERIALYRGGWLWLRARLKHVCCNESHWKRVCKLMSEVVLPQQLVADFARRYNSYAPFKKFSKKEPLPDGVDTV